MSVRTMRMINTIGLVLTIAALGFGSISIFNYFGGLNSSLAVSLSMFGFYGLVVTAVFAAAIRRRRIAAKSPAIVRNAFAVLLRTHHRVDPISRDETAVLLLSLVDNPSALGRIVRGGRCRDCGHGEIVLQNAHDELFLITTGAKLVDLQQWFFGVFGVWQRQEPIAPLTTGSLET